MFDILLCVFDKKSSNRSHEMEQGYSTNSEPRDRITISLFGTQQESEKAVGFAIKEFDNIRIINQKMAQAARRAGRQPPQIVISILIIPDWEKGYHYGHDDYIIAMRKFFDDLNRHFTENFKFEKDEDVRVENFYTDANLVDVEKGYLEGLIAKGSNADMIKNHAIIRDDNIKRRHLQMDSNTKIFDFELLYNETFNNPLQQDALNACYYDRQNQYVSAHNKIVYSAVYTPVQSQFAFTLKNVHINYCRLHKDDHKDLNNPAKVAEKKEKNSIYSKDFVVALEQRGLAQKKTLRAETDSPQVVYLAVMDKPEYRLTKCVATAVNMSWSTGNTQGDADAIATQSALKQLPSVQIKDALCDYVCFANAVLKYTDELANHGEDAYDDTLAHSQLLAISNQTLEREMIRKFLEQVKETKPEMLEKVLDTMNIATKRGRNFFIDVFGCKPEDYKEVSQTKKFKQ